MDNEQRSNILSTLGLIQATKISKPDKDIQKYIRKAYNDSVYDFYKHLFKAQFISNFMQEGIVPHEPVNENMLEIIGRARDNVSTKPPYILLTVNPKPNTTLKELQKAVEKFINRRICRAYKYVYEIRTEKHEGLHCHMLINYTCKPYDFKRASKSTFKHICDTKNPSILNHRFIDPSDLPQKIEYLLGNKQKKKEKSVEWSRIYREKHKLEQIYSSELPLELEVPLLGSVTTDDEIMEVI